MASLSGWVFVIVGGSVATWSYFQDSLLFFTVVGGVMALYGVSKIIIARAFKKSDSSLQKQTGHTTNQRVHAHEQIQTYTNMRNQQQNAQNYSHNAHVHQQHRGIAPPQTHLPNHQRAGAAVVQQAHPATLHQPQTAYKICPNCKKHMHVTYRFCPHCGWGV